MNTERISRSILEGNPSVVNKNVYSSVFLLEIIFKRNDARFVCYVQLVKLRLETQLVQLRHCGAAPTFVAGCEVHHACELLAEALHDAEADALVGAGDDRNSLRHGGCVWS